MIELFIEKPCDYFICGLCAEVMKNPVQCPQGHTFCKDCFKTALSIKGQCPIRCSEKKLDSSMLVVNRIVGDMIGELKVRCSSRVDSIDSIDYNDYNDSNEYTIITTTTNTTTDTTANTTANNNNNNIPVLSSTPESPSKTSSNSFSSPPPSTTLSSSSLSTNYLTVLPPNKKLKIAYEEGCNWCGEYKNLLQHEKECQFIKQRCPNYGCSVQLRMKEMICHLDKCLYRYTVCLLCSLPYQVIDEEDHNEICLGKFIDCPNDCHLSFKKSELQDHLLVCPNEMILCKYHTVGCKHHAKRNEIESHEENLVIHFPLLTNVILHQQNQITELTKQIKSRNTITTDMIFTIPDFQISQVYTSHRQRIDGIEYYLIFHPNNDLIHHSVYLVFPELTQTITCRTICSLCKSESRDSSHTRRSIFAEYTPDFYYKSFADFIQSNRILTDGFIKADRSITIIETIVMLIS